MSTVAAALHGGSRATFDLHIVLAEIAGSIGHRIRSNSAGASPRSLTILK